MTISSGFPADDFICKDQEIYTEYKKIWHSFSSNKWMPTKESISLSESEKALALCIFKAMYQEVYPFIKKDCSDGRYMFKDFVYIASHEYKELMRGWMYNASTIITLLRESNSDVYNYEQEVDDSAGKINDLDSLFYEKESLINGCEFSSESKITIDI